MLQNPHVLLTFDKVHNPLRLPRKTTSEPPKVARTCSVSLRNVLPRHNGAALFRHLNCQKWSGPGVFCTF